MKEVWHLFLSVPKKKTRSVYLSVPIMEVWTWRCESCAHQFFFSVPVREVWLLFLVSLNEGRMASV